MATKSKHTYTAKALPETGLVRLPSILAVMPISRTALYNKISSGDFPAPIKLGPKTSAWRVEDVRDALAKIGCSI